MADEATNPAGYALPARAIRELQQVKTIVLGSSRSKSRKFRRRRNPGAGTSTTSLTAFALVVTTAGANGSSPGTAVLLADGVPLVPLDADGDPLILDEDDPEYDAGLVDDVKFTFYSAHTDSACNAGERIRVFSTVPIEPGGEADPEHPVQGLNVDGSGYWQGHGSFGNSKYLGATGDEALYREFTTGLVAGSGTGSCEGDGIIFTFSGGTFVIPPTEPPPP